LLEVSGNLISLPQKLSGLHVTSASPAKLIPAQLWQRSPLGEKVYLWLIYY